MSNPKISILMTVFNHEKFVKTSIKSILSQNYKNFELIVVNNGSSDQSGNIIKKIRDRRIKKFFLKKNIGRTKCLNYGLKKCKGKYVAIQDSDDISKKNRLKKQINFLENNSEIPLVASLYNLIDETDKKIQRKINSKTQNIKEEMFINNLVAHSTVMYRRSLLSKIGVYPKNFYYAQDYAFYLKVLKFFPIRILNDRLVDLRSNHKNSETFRLNKSFTILREEINLIKWISQNFKLKFWVKLKIFFKLIKIIFKFFVVILKKL